MVADRLWNRGSSVRTSAHIGIMKRAIFFVDILTIYTWFVYVLPRLLSTGAKVRPACYVFNASFLCLAVARTFGRIVGISVDLLEFRYLDIKDGDGTCIGRRISHFDLLKVRDRILQGEPQLQSVLSRLKAPMELFLGKQGVSSGISDSTTFEHQLFLVQVAGWIVRDRGLPACDLYLFLRRRPFMAALGDYAAHNGISLIPLPQARDWDIRMFLKRYLNYRGVRILINVYRSGVRSNRFGKDEQAGLVQRPSDRPLLAVQYHGLLNLREPGRFSDLFFWQQSSLEARDIAVIFSLPQDPLDDAKLSELAAFGLTGIATNRRSITTSQGELFTYELSPRGVYRDDDRLVREGIGRSLEGAWLRRHVELYQYLRGYWHDLFVAYGLKVYVNWYKHDGGHCIIADVLEELGGISVVYQRSYEEFPGVPMMVATDVEFAFSIAHAEVERKSGSIIPYHVTMGLPGDHRGALLETRATELRRTLIANGAKTIVAFFDENTLGDPRWHQGHEFTRANYAYLLERVLQIPWLGLVVKPKNPRTLRARLGPVADLLDQAEATGRCHVYEEAIIQSAHPPVLAALAADLAVHEHLYAATAAIESYVAGTPTLLFDGLGWPVSSLYALGEGKVVFKEWDLLWDACMDHWGRAGGIPGFGDWAPVIEELDPFRDGRAAERMGTYLQWLVEGLKAGLDRETVMADAAERYTKAWGADKIQSVN